MTFDSALRLGGFFVGTALHGMLFAAALRRAASHRSVVLLRCVLGVAFMWHAGNFVSAALVLARREATSRGTRFPKLGY